MRSMKSKEREEKKRRLVQWRVDEAAFVPACLGGFSFVFTLVWFLLWELSLVYSSVVVALWDLSCLLPCLLLLLALLLLLLLCGCCFDYLICLLFP